jgi:glycosyltransferase involved in cell wall biosynthesis
MAISFTPSDIVAGLALLLSAYATWKTVQFNEKQKSLIESQERLNRRLLEKEDAESNEEKKADLGATFIKLGSSNYRLKIWNKGKAVARNVSIEFPEGNDCLVESDIKGKFPLETLDTRQSVELIASVHMGTKSKQTIKLCWADDLSATNEKVVYPTL